MNKNILTASVLLSAGVLGLANPAQALDLSIGDGFTGSGQRLVVGVDEDLSNPVQLYFGSDEGIMTESILLGQAGLVTEYAELHNFAEASVNNATPIPSGFDPFVGQTAKIQSYLTAEEGFVEGFLTVEAEDGTHLIIDIEREFFSAGFFPDPTGGPFFLGQANAIIRGSNHGSDIYHGTFRLSTENIAPDAFGPNVGDTDGKGSVDLVSLIGSYSYAVEVTSVVPVPESSNIIGLLSLGALGVGVALKNKSLQKKG